MAPNITLCATPFWNTTFTWYSSRPQLTPCFEKTFIPLLPAVFLLLALPLDLRQLIQRSSLVSHPLPWKTKTLYKMALHLLFLLSEIAFTALSVIAATKEEETLVLNTIIDPLFQLLSFVTALIVALIHRKCGKRVSLSLNVFWFIVTITSLWRSYSCYVNGYTLLTLKYEFYAFFGILALIDSSYPDPPPVFHPLGYDPENYCCFETVPFFSLLTFAWMFRIFKISQKEKLETNHFYPMCKDIKSETLLRQYDQIHEKHQSSRLIFNLLRLIRTKVLTSVVFDMTSTFFTMLQPVAIGLIIDMFNTGNHGWHGVVFCLIFVMGAMGEFVSDTYRLYFAINSGIKAVSALTSVIYRKCFTLSPSARKEYTSGEVTNIVSVDLQELLTFFSTCCMILSIPLKFGLCIFMLWVYLRLAIVAALGVVLVMVLITYFLNKKLDKLQTLQMKLKDKRTKQISEAFRGIKIVKLYAWEPPFIDWISKTRREELKTLRSFYFWDIGYTIIWSMAHWIIAAACFATFIVIYPTKALDAKTVFVSISLFLILRQPMTMLTYIITQSVRTNVSLKRIEKLLHSPDLEHYISDCSDVVSEKNVRIRLKNASLTWNPEEKTTLKNVTLEVNDGSLVAVVGKVGAGKSSILSAVIGDMYKLDGEVMVSGSTAYVPQEAWIQNATVKDNITFSSPYDAEKYSRVLEACALLSDLNQLPGGDMTEIGERGVNLSGGQRQRINLARAVYQQKDIYLLDDPLSAVDAHVANHLFEQVIGPGGLLDRKTRLLATHHLTFLPRVDMIIVVDNGEIVDMGTYDYFVQKGTLSMYIGESDDAEVDEGKAKEESKGPSDVKQMVTGTEGSKLIEEEEYEVGVVHWKHYFSYIKSVTFIFCILVMFSTFSSNICEVGSNLWLAYWTAHPKFWTPSINISIYSGIILGGLLSMTLSALFMYIGAMKASVTVHQGLLSRILRCPLSFFETNPLGRILNRFSRDISSVDEGIPNNFVQVITLCTYYPLLYCMLAFDSVTFLSLILVVVIVYYNIYKLFVWTSRQLQRLTSVTKSPVFSFVGESINGVPTLRAFKMEGVFKNKLAEKVDLNMNSWYTQTSANRALECWIGVAGGVILFITTAGLLYNSSSITDGQAGFVLNYTIEALYGIFWFVRVVANLEVNMVAMERIGEYLALKEEKELRVSGLPKQWATAGKIQFKDYSTTYREGLEPVLKRINLTIESKQKVGIVGRTGAGKSSLTLSLFRIIEPTTGTILIDDVDVTKIGLHDLRQSLTIIPQDAFLFTGTLRLNLDPWSEHDDDALWDALRKADLKDYFTSTGAGLDYEINDSGSNLSAGQKQLVCLARALLRKTKILVLDEATASVDMETDRFIQETIRDIFSDCTVLTIAHRLHTILDYDRIIVLSKGIVAEDGSPNELLAREDSEFAKMARDAGIMQTSS